MVTARLNVLNKRRQPTECRALLDTASTTNFIKESLAVELQLPRKPFAVPVGALNAMNTKTKYLVTATIRSRVTGYEKTMDFLTIPQITQLMPEQTLDREAIPLPQGIKLADPQFHQPSSIDILLGSGPTLSVLRQGHRTLALADQSELHLQETLFGWVIGGSAPTTQPVRQRVCNVLHTSNIEADLAKFWEIEEVSTEKTSSSEEEIFMKHFQENTKRSPSGRYTVALPFNGKELELGESRSRAYRRLLALERRLDKDPILREQYEAVIQEYIDLGHAEDITDADLAENGYYQPHHAVVKDSSTTTKVRVVFDASAETSTGLSLNDVLLNGPMNQENMLVQLLELRTYPIIITADIKMMYRQIEICQAHRKFLRFLWRQGRHLPVRTYQLTRVPFGAKPSPALAIETIRQLAKDEQHRYPLAAKVLMEKMYVDNLLVGCGSREEAIQLRDELQALVQLGGFELRQWASNDQAVLEGLLPEIIDSRLILGDSTLKTLGIFWNTGPDVIAFETTLRADRAITKRTILSETARLFDPYGLIAPLVIVAKMIMQKLWTLKTTWDEPLPPDICAEWLLLYEHLPLLKPLEFPREVVTNNAQEIQLHGFSDASQDAYGACVYVRSIGKKGEIKTRLLYAKSKVAPLKRLTIPRLELCGAQLLVNIVQVILTKTSLKVDQVVYWTDSTIVLHWIHTPANKLQTFVSNRITDIQHKSQPCEWRHVRTRDNPADLISRGQTVQEFIKTSIWPCGPSWLQQPEEEWPKLHLQFSTPPTEMKKQFCHVTYCGRQQHPLEWYSSIHKLQRVIAYCRRFKTQQRGPLSAAELIAAQKGIIHWLQLETFTSIRQTLQSTKTNSKRHRDLAKIAKLSPFIDKDGLIRVGGRLQHSMLPYTQRHPIILPKRHTVTILILEDTHLSHLHSGPQATLYAVRQKYWPLDGRNLVHSIIKKCIRCTRLNPPPVKYIMGNLPAARVTVSRPFTHVGIDYCGPFFLKEKKHRNRNRIKVYVAVFVCLTVKAVHLEVVSELTTDAFLAALRRFIARRGHCASIHSDNGTNFVGANNKLKEIYELVETNKADIQNFLAKASIEWHFIPPQSPNFGGLWEAAVKSFKHHLHRVITDELLTFEDFNTLTIEIEAVLNSRPLTPLPSDANDLQVLTPGHFLIGETLTCLRERDFTDTPSNRLSSWEHIQKLKQHFWARWHREYIGELNLRSKWSTGEHKIQEGTMVLLKEDNLPALQWALGRVIKAHPGADGIIRAVTVRTARGVFDRNVKKLAPLTFLDEEVSQPPLQDRTNGALDPST